MHPVLRLALYFLAGYGLLVATVYLLQRRMIYAPDNTEPSVDTLRAAGLRTWPSPGKDFLGYIAATAPATPMGTVIVFHGNAGTAWHRDYFVHALVPLGFHVVLAEYPGYGGRPGETSESSFSTDALGIVERAHTEFGGPVYLLGESMGAGVAAAVAGKPPVPAAGLILITPWATLPDLAQTLYWYLPARWLTRDRFDNLNNLRDFSRPVAMAIASRDRVVPNGHSLRLYQALSAPKRLWTFENAGHSDWPSSPQAGWWREVMQFVSAPPD